jgi:hypothetical protein
MSNIKPHDKITIRPETATVPTQAPRSRIARRTQGHRPITRLMSHAQSSGVSGEDGLAGAYSVGLPPTPVLSHSRAKARAASKSRA